MRFGKYRQYRRGQLLRYRYFTDRIGRVQVTYQETVGTVVDKTCKGTVVRLGHHGPARSGHHELKVRGTARYVHRDRSTGGRRTVDGLVH